MRTVEIQNPRARDRDHSEASASSKVSQYETTRAQWFARRIACSLAGFAMLGRFYADRRRAP
jgi:hypothetical protein